LPAHTYRQPNVISGTHVPVLIDDKSSTITKFYVASLAG